MWGSGRLNDLAQVRELIKGRAGLRPRFLSVLFLHKYALENL